MSTRSVLFINRVYPPLDGATGQLLAELAPALAAAGWRVTVLTSRAQGTGAGPESERIDEVQVERVAALGWAGASLWRRTLSYLALYPALLWRALGLPRHEVIVLLTDPPLLIVLGIWLSWATGGRLVHWAQDLYPEVAEEMGVLRKGGLLAEALRWLSGLGLRRCAAVVAVGQCMREQLLRRGILPERLSVIPNWAVGTWRSNAPEYPPAPAAAQFRRDQGWENRFVVMYSGNFGRAHDFEPILDAAEEWERRAANIWLVLSGHGPRRAWMEKEVTRRGLGRVSWLAWQPAERLSASLGAADMHIASLREELCGLVVPSKVYGILGAGRPCLFLGPRESEVARLIERAGCGEVLSGANGARLAQCLVAWSRDPDRVEAAAGQSRRLRTELSGVVAARLFGEVLQRVRGEGPLLLQGFTPEPGRGEVGVNAGGVERERAA